MQERLRSAIGCFLQVEAAIQSSWFAAAMAEDADAIVVLNHFGLTDPLVGVLLEGIRAHTDRLVFFLSGCAAGSVVRQSEVPLRCLRRRSKLLTKTNILSNFTVSNDVKVS